MNKNKLHTIRLMIVFLAGMGLTGFTKGKAPSDAPLCGVILKFGKATEVIPPEGRVQSRFQENAPLQCGSMIVTHANGMWIRHSNQTVYRIGPNSFFEIAREPNAEHRLYRGVLLATVPSGTSQRLVTPNGKIVMTGGTVWIQYHPQEKETSVASFSKTIHFQNKFHDGTNQEVHAGEISRLSLNGNRVVPSQPELLYPGSVKGSLTSFDLGAEEETQFIEGVEKIFESRAKSFAAELENWKDIETRIETVDEPNRKIASSIDESEVEFTHQLMKERLYGESEKVKQAISEQKTDRSPASRPVDVLKDPLYESEKIRKEKEAKRLFNEISDLDPNSED